MIKLIRFILVAVIYFLPVVLSGANSNPWPTSGSVGIGTSSPTDLLHVEGGYGTGMHVGNGTTNLAIRSFGSSLTGIPGSTFGIQMTGPLHSHVVLDIPGNDSSDGFYVRVPSSLQLNPTVDKVALAVKGNGFLGVGTSNPGGLITAYNNTDGAANWTAIFESRRTSGNIYMKFKNLAYTGGSDYLFFADQNGNVGYHQTGVGNQFLLNQSGNVGIGTSTPDYKLDVLGTIRANEVIVETGWSDFVFEDGYDLPTLNEVSEFIDKNGHLPDIPSAEEVAENGITLGNMNARLLQKIEELTLYTIEQEDRLETQGEQLSKQQQLIEQLLAANAQLTTDVQTLKATLSH